MGGIRKWPTFQGDTLVVVEEWRTTWTYTVCLCVICLQLQGAVLLSSVLQVVLGFSGLLGLLLRWIGPITIAPTIAMVGLSLFDAAYFKAQGQWWIAIT